MHLKSRISTPLEAGVSILDVHRIPSYLVPALEFTARRLATKGLHVTLAVARRDYQLPGYAMATKSATRGASEAPFTALPTPPGSPDALVRSPSDKFPQSSDRPDAARTRQSKTGPMSRKSSLASLFDGSLGSPRLRWTSTSNATPFSPKTPKTPKTPNTPASCLTATSTTSSVACGSLGAQGPEIRLIHTTSLAPRAYKLVAATLARASRKFNLATTLTAHEASTYNIPAVVLHGSILQNEVLHSSEGLTLLSLDHLYTFKSALLQYGAIRTEPGSHLALEDAVDELRRYVLSSTAGRRRLLKSTLVQAFDWLGPVNETALAEVTIMYARAYGAATDTGVSDDLIHTTSNVPVQDAWESLDGAMDDRAAGRTALATPELPMRSAARTAKGSWDAVVVEGNTTPVPTHAPQTWQQTPAAPPPPPPPPPPPFLPRPLPSPKMRPAAPTLRLQTSFPAAVHKPAPTRRKTPLPAASKRHARTSTAPLPHDHAVSLPIFLSPAASPTDADADDADDDAASLQTDFEDAELMARSPCAVGAKTPGGSIWLGIDDILSGGGGGGGWSRRRSSDLFLPTPVAGDAVGPMTPNGFEDISPVTRGEWGMLMVGESFRTRTAGVSCV